MCRLRRKHQDSDYRAGYWERHGLRLCSLPAGGLDLASAWEAGINVR